MWNKVLKKSNQLIQTSRALPRSLEGAVQEGGLKSLLQWLLGGHDPCSPPPPLWMLLWAPVQTILSEHPAGLGHAESLHFGWWPRLCLVPRESQPNAPEEIDAALSPQPPSPPLSLEGIGVSSRQNLADWRLSLPGRRSSSVTHAAFWVQLWAPSWLIIRNSLDKGREMPYEWGGRGPSPEGGFTDQGESLGAWGGGPTCMPLWSRISRSLRRARGSRWPVHADLQPRPRPGPEQTRPDVCWVTES